MKQLGQREPHTKAADQHHAGGRMQGILQARLLLLLSQKPTHGYGLMERLSQAEDVPSADPGLLYRTLRRLEEEGMVWSSWNTEGKGPARRLYQITPDGVEYLDAWAVKIRQLRKRLDRFLEEHEAYSIRETSGAAP